MGILWIRALGGFYFACASRKGIFNKQMAKTFYEMFGSVHNISTLELAIMFYGLTNIVTGGFSGLLRVAPGSIFWGTDILVEPCRWLHIDRLPLRKICWHQPLRWVFVH